MNFKKILSVLFASTLFFSGCVKDVPTDSFENIKLDCTYLTIPLDGGSVELTVTATAPWKFVIDENWPEKVKFVKGAKAKHDEWGNLTNDEADIDSKTPTWLTASVLEGESGETKVTFSAEKSEAGREFELAIVCERSKQFVRVRQGSMAAESASCKDVIDGPDGKTYRVKGTCTSIANTTYGNWYLNDGTGEIYIYGTLNADGEKQKFSDWGLEVGDVVELEGPKTTYNGTVELVDVTVIEIQKSLLKILSKSETYEKEGGEFEIVAAYKGKSVNYNIPEECKEWVSISGITTKAGTPSKLEPNPADTAFVTVKLAPNEGSLREGSVELSSTTGSSTTSLSYDFSQAGDVVEASLKDIKDVVFEGTSNAPKAFVVNLKGATVTYVNGKNAFIEDETAGLLIYLENHGYKAGDVLSGEFAGAGYAFNGLAEVTDITTKPEVTSGEAPAATEATLAQILDDFAAYDSRLVLVKNLSIVDGLGPDDRSGKATQDGKEIALYDKTKNVVIAEGSVGDLTCIPGVNKETKQLTVWKTEHFVASGEQADFLKAEKSELTIAADATEASFSVKSNVAWTVAKTEGDWVTSFTERGENDGAIEIVCEANTGEERVAKFTLSAEGVNPVELTLTQRAKEVVYNTLAEITAAGEYNVKDLTVYAVPNVKNAVVGDGTGYILFYVGAGHNLVAGDTFDTFGEVKSYYGLLEFSDAEVSNKVAGTAPTEFGTAIEATPEFLTAYPNAVTTTYVHAKGSQSGRNISVAGSEVALYLNAAVAETDGKEVEVYGFTYGYYSSSKTVSFVPTSIEEIVGTAPVTGVSLDQTALDLKVGGKATLTATVAPADAANKNVSWSSSDVAVATVEDGVVTAVAEGEAIITVTTEDGGYTATCAVTVVAAGEGGEDENPFETTVAYTKGTNCYDDGVATVNGEAGVKVLRFGTSKASGNCTVTIPAGSTKLVFYGVAWKGTPDVLTAKIGDAVQAALSVAANAGATANSPYTITVTENDFYTIEFSEAVAVDTQLSLSTGKRIIIWGVKAK